MKTVDMRNFVKNNTSTEANVRTTLLTASPSGLLPTATFDLPSAAVPATTKTEDKNLEISFEYVTVTPELATSLLENAHLNRRISQPIVDKYAADMRNGWWKNNGESLKFDSLGKLVDGEHRLWAVVKSGTAVKFLVAYNVPLAVRHTLDSGRRRSHSDQKRINDNYAFGNRDNAILRAVDLVFNSNSRVRSTASIDEEIKKFLPAIAALTPVFGKSVHRRITSYLVQSAFVFAYASNPSAVVEAATKYVTGTGLAQNDPLWMLREYISTAVVTGGSNRRKPLFKSLQAIYLHLTGQSRSKLMSSKEGAEAFAKAYGETKVQDVA